MINFSLSIKNPFVEKDLYKEIFSNHGPIEGIANKYWEFDLAKTDTLINMALDITTKQDHAGIYIEFGLGGYMAGFNIYDSRHWDYDKNTWKEYNN